MVNLGNYHLVLITRKKRLLTNVQAIINLKDMKFIDDPKNYVLVRRDYNAYTPSANILETGVNGNLIFKDTMAELLNANEDTLTIVILLNNFDGHLGTLLTNDRHKLTHEKMETLAKSAVDAVVLGGIRAHQPSNLMNKFKVSAPKRLHLFQGPVSMARCGIKLETFYTEGFMADKASPGIKNYYLVYIVTN